MTLPNQAKVIVNVCGPQYVDVKLNVKSRVYLMDFHNSLGPTFYHRNGAPYFPGKHAPIWKEFEKWDRQRMKKEKT
jgi:hypothetical protein